MNEKTKICVVFVLSLLQISTISAPSSPDSDIEHTEFRTDLSDAEIEDESRRRNIGGPWDPNQAFAILQEAISQLDPGTAEKRARQFNTQAQAVLGLLTGIENPVVEREADDSTDSDYMDEPEEIGSGHRPSRETMAKILDMVDGKNGQRRRKEDSIRTLYPWYHRNYAARFRAILEGRRFDKLREMNKRVFAQFKDARAKLQPVHGRTIQRWARQHAQQLNITSFGASDSWLKAFKKRFGIVSRKVTNYIGRSELSKGPEITTRLIDFREKYNKTCRFFDKSQILNFDQTGFQYEASNLRTLSLEGERDTELMIDSRNKHSHSYTAQPMVSRDGRLFNKLLLVLQEKDGVFGPKIKQQVATLERKYGNIEVYASQSGKLSANLIDNWFKTTLKDVIHQAVKNHTIHDDEPAVVLLADSWSGHSSARQQAELRQMGAEVLQIPPSTTDKLQPLDVNYNRQYKIFYNRIAEEAFYDDMISNITSRDGIINVQSLIHDQLCSDKYRDMLIYAWRNTDPAFNRSELTNFPPKMVQDIQFNFDPTLTCQAPRCTNHAFIRCSHCGKLMCLHHFLERECTHHSRNRRSIDGESCESDGNCDEPITVDEPKVSNTTNALTETSGIASFLAGAAILPIANAAVASLTNLNAGAGTLSAAPASDPDAPLEELVLPDTTRRLINTPKPRSKTNRKFRLPGFGRRRGGRN